jgi:hypothetical protein
MYLLAKLLARRSPFVPAVHHFRVCLHAGMILSWRSVSLASASEVVVLIKWVSDVSRCCHVALSDDPPQQVADQQ